MKKTIAIAALMMTFGLAHAQTSTAPSSPSDAKNGSTTVSGAPASNARGTRGKSTPIIARTAQPGSTGQGTPDAKEGMKAAPATPAAAPQPIKDAKE